jgi:hypothetical protein
MFYETDNWWVWNRNLWDLLFYDETFWNCLSCQNFRSVLQSLFQVDAGAKSFSQPAISSTRSKFYDTFGSWFKHSLFQIYTISATVNKKSTLKWSSIKKCRAMFLNFVYECKVLSIIFNRPKQVVLLIQESYLTPLLLTPEFTQFTQCKMTSWQNVLAPVKKWCIHVLSVFF